MLFLSMYQYMHEALCQAKACLALHCSAHAYVEEVCEKFLIKNNCIWHLQIVKFIHFHRKLRIFFRLFLGFHFAASGWSHCMCSLFRLCFSLLHLCWISCGASAFSSYCRMDKLFVHVPTLRTADDFPAWKQAVRLACMSLDVCYRRWGGAWKQICSVSSEDQIGRLPLYCSRPLPRTFFELFRKPRLHGRLQNA